MSKSLSSRILNWSIISVRNQKLFQERKKRAFKSSTHHIYVFICIFRCKNLKLPATVLPPRASLLLQIEEWTGPPQMSQVSGTSQLHGQRSAPTSTSTYKCVLYPKYSVLYQLSQVPIHCIIWFQNNLFTNLNYIITALNNVITRLNSISQWIYNSSLKRQNQHNVCPLLSHTIRFSLWFRLNQWQKVTWNRCNWYVWCWRCLWFDPAHESKLWWNTGNMLRQYHVWYFTLYSRITSNICATLSLLLGWKVIPSKVSIISCLGYILAPLAPNTCSSPPWLTCFKHNVH